MKKRFILVILIWVGFLLIIIGDNSVETPVFKMIFFMIGGLTSLISSLLALQPDKK